MRAVLAARSRRVALTAPAPAWLQLAAKTVPAAAAPRFAMLMAAVLAARTQPRLAQAVQFPMPRRPRVRWSLAWPATARRALAQQVPAQVLTTLAVAQRVPGYQA